MKTFSQFFDFSVDFTRKYFFEYILAILKYILITIVGAVIFSIGILLADKYNLFFILISLISLPFFCFAMWKLFFITYCLTPLADSILNGGDETFSAVIEKNKEKEKDFLVFCTKLFSPFLILMVLFVLLYIITHFSRQSNFAFIMGVLLTLSLFIALFLSFYLYQIYYYKKTDSVIESIKEFFVKADKNFFMILFFILVLNNLIYLFPKNPIFAIIAYVFQIAVVLITVSMITVWAHYKNK